MSPDDVFTLLVAADPAPDGGETTTLAPVLERLRPPDNGSPPMTLTTTVPVETSSGSSGPRKRMLAAAAAVIVALGIGAFALTRDDAEPAPPADPPVQSLPAVPNAEDVAIEKARTYIDAMNRGDADTALAMTNLEVANVEADRNMIEMLGVINRFTGQPALGPCETSGGLDAWIEVRCQFVVTEPVAVELDAAERIFPVRVYDNGTVKWQPFEGADFTAAGWAVTDYLQAFHPDEHEAVCLPAAYPVGSVHTVANSALTAACAELWAPLGDDVVQWLRDGKPQS